MDHLESALKALLAGVTCVTVLVGLGKLARRYVIIPKLTILYDLPQLGTPRLGGRIRGTAVICGGSMAGLMAAAVCADHFESVTIIEPEASANEAAGTEFLSKIETRTDAHGLRVPLPPRKRIVQWYANHGFQPPLYTALQRLFPNFQEELRLLKIKPVVALLRLAGFTDPYEAAYMKDDIHSGLPLTLSVSRVTMETLLRRLVLGSRPNVEIITGTVTGLQRSSGDVGPTDDRITGVMVRTDEGEVVKSVDLVIDATGPAQAGLKWLKAAGYPLPQPDLLRDSYDPKHTTIDGVYTIPLHLQESVPLPWGKFKPGFVGAMPSNQFEGDDGVMLISVVDHDKLRIATWGPDPEILPHSASQMHAHWTELSGRVRKPFEVPGYFLDVCQFLEEHEEECAPFWVKIHVGALSWVKYHQVPEGALPRNYIAMGDAVMKLNPARGSGVSKIVYDTATLDACLRSLKGQGDLPSDFSRKFFKVQADRIKGFWDDTKDSDYASPSTIPVKGETLNEGNFKRKFAQRLLEVCMKDADVRKAVYYVAMYLAPPTDLLSPSVAIKVARQWLLG